MRLYQLVPCAECIKDLIEHHHCWKHGQVTVEFLGAMETNLMKVLSNWHELKSVVVWIKLVMQLLAA